MDSESSHQQNDDYLKDSHAHKFLHKKSSKIAKNNRLNSTSTISSHQKKICQSSNTLALKLFDVLEDNCVCSPIGIGYILSFPHMGSVCKTEQQITNLMTIKNSPDDLMACSKTFNSDIMQLENLILVNKNMQIKQEYLKMVEQLAIVSNEDFSDKNAICHKTNEFFKQNNTNNLIKDILKTDMIDSDSAIILINTVNFKTVWAVPFEKYGTRWEKFNKTKEIKMMKNIGYYSYYEDKFAQLIMLPYKGNEFCMGVILPKENVDFNQCVDYLGKNITYTTEYVDIHFPKFTQRRNIDLIPLMQKMGVTDLFSSQKARLDRMTTCDGTYVSTFIHGAVVQVDEAGTGATAGAVAVCTDESSMVGPKSIVFYANRSFIYYIEHIPTNTPLIVGDFHGN